MCICVCTSQSLFNETIPTNQPHNQKNTKQYLPTAFPKVYICEPEEGLLACEWLEVDIYTHTYIYMYTQ
jgi:hypothetical protein